MKPLQWFARAACLPVCLLAIQPGTCARGPAGATTPAKPAAARTASIRVVDEHNSPIAGATVKLQLRPKAPLPDLLEETTVTTTSSTGEFPPPSNAPAGSLLIVEAPGLGTMAYHADKLPPAITLPPAAPLTGTVVDDRGTSIAGALIGPIEPPAKCEHDAHDAPHPEVSPVRFVQTDANGCFQVPDLETHKYQLLIRAPEFQPRAFIAQSGTTVSLMLYRGGTTLVGQVVGTRDRQPQPGVFVQATHADIRLYDQTDAAGQFRFTNLPPGEWLVRQYVPGSAVPGRAEGVNLESSHPETSVTLLLNQGGSIAGQLVDANTSAPLAGVAVGISGDSHQASTMSDSDGYFHFDDADALEHYTLRFDRIKYVRVLPNGELRDYYDIAPTDAADRTNIVIGLAPRALVEGRVVDNTGTAVAGARVTLQALAGSGTRADKLGIQREQHAQFSASTDSTGKFRVGVYPAGKFEASAAAEDGRVAATQTIDAYTTFTAPAIELRLQSSASLAGTVVDANDQPVTGALVLAMPAAMADNSTAIDSHDESKYPSAHSDPHGEFAIQGVALGQQVALRASHPDYLQPASKTVTAGSAEATTTSTLRLAFPSGGEFSARVVNEQNQPLSGATVIVQYSAGLDGRQLTRETDDRGELRLHAIPGSQLDRVVVRHPQYSDYDASAQKLPLQNETIQLKHRGSIIVHVKAPPSLTPQQLQVILLNAPAPPASNTQPAPPAPESFTESSRASVTNGTAEFRDLNAGWYKAALAAPYTESAPVLVPGETGAIELQVDAASEAQVPGHVEDAATKQGIPGAAITIAPAAQLNETPDNSSRTIYSDGSGNFTVSAAAGSSVHVKVVAYGYPDYEQTVAITGNKLEILLSNAAGALAGSVTMAGKPVESALLVLSKPQSAETPLATAVSDAAGNFTLSGFSAGTYVLTVEAPAGSGNTTTRRSETVQVTDTSSRHDIKLPSLVHVTGTVKLGGKVPARADGSSVPILFSPASPGPEGRSVQLNTDGSFATDIEPGTYNVGIEDRPGDKVEITDQPNQHLNLQF